MPRPLYNLRLSLLIVLLATTMAAFGCRRMETGPAAPPAPAGSATPTASPVATDQLPLAFGNPSAAGQTDDNNFLVVGTGSVFSYNGSRRTINWVYWRTTKADLGDKLLRPDFQPDPRLPDRFHRVGYFDYSGSGYDRGHMVPSADRFGDPNENAQTFMMTNIVPQTKALNQFPWEKLESYARSQARRGWDVYQIAGVYGHAGTTRRKIVVPTNCWKILVLMRRGSTVDQIGTRTRIIAVDMPNIEGIEEQPWSAYKTTIREIERKTGYDFFAMLPRDVQDTIETRMEMENPGPNRER